VDARVAPCYILKPVCGVPDLQGTDRRHVYIMSHHVCNYVHRFVLQFYVSFYIFIPHVVS
jgi:hypothetical protein